MQPRCALCTCLIRMYTGMQMHITNILYFSLSILKDWRTSTTCNKCRGESFMKAQTDIESKT